MSYKILFIRFFYDVFYDLKKIFNFKMGEMSPFDYLFVCEGFGGICTVLVGHRFTTIKESLPWNMFSKRARYNKFKSKFSEILWFKIKLNVFSLDL